MISLSLATAVPAGASNSPLQLKNAPTDPSDFPIVADARAAEILVDQADAAVVRTASDLFASDVERVTGATPKVIDAKSLTRREAPVIVVGTLGKSALIDGLVANGKLDPSSIRGRWESYIIATLDEPAPGVPRALVIAGSDRRGTAYGVFDLSKAIGVSPWVWWADVAPAHREELVLAAGTHIQGPPSVKYRGIFLNDEDWGLRPWAAKTFEPETGNIGPKTYAKICELLLRLRANLLWPAMHHGTTAFNLIPENRVVADHYAIVMGSSHAEPMLRNNVGEWPAGKEALWNPVTNLPAIVQYWEERVKENARYENVYTIGMRGVHDSGMPGGGTTAEKRDRLENIIKLQRALLAKYVNPNPALVPQIFCPYKEVLEIYQSGMHLPDDVTVVWPDDNNGYIRQLPTSQERERSGGHGIYYHLSYWGRPHDYLWLDSTSPALIWHEMSKAYALGAGHLWVANVGDLKSIETGMTFFLDLAWNIDRYGPDAQRAFLRDFYADQFGAEHADEIAALRDEYYRLCAIRRPEHMGFNRVYPNTPVQNSGWSPEESSQFLERWRDVAQRAKSIGAKMPARLRDAYFELVEYPACGGAAMAEKLLLAERARETGSQELAKQAESAFERIHTLTAEYNTAGHGKWHDIMSDRPRRLPVFGMPPTQPGSVPAAPSQSTSSPAAIHLDPANFLRREDRDSAGWRVIEGLGPRGHALAVLPQRDTPTRRSANDIVKHCPVAEYAVKNDNEGVVTITIEALPTHRLTPVHDTIVAVSIGDGDPGVVHFDEGVDDEYDATWQRNVLRGAMFGATKLRVPKGPYTLKVWAADPAVVIQRITVEPSADSGS
ncbi:MAG TPA: glycosyl hydrolase 115 family protein [Opitutaceae bacterium]|nr:glycosyl hydrolase 115 family protein [Opitutaceae bacterium]